METPAAKCGAVNTLLDEYIGHVASRIREPRSIMKHLKELRQQRKVTQTAEDFGIRLNLSKKELRDPSPARLGAIRSACMRTDRTRTRRVVSVGEIRRARFAPADLL